MRVAPVHFKLDSEMVTQQCAVEVIPCLEDHQFKMEELETVGELSEVCSQIETRHSLVREQTCTSCHKMDKSL